MNRLLAIVLLLLSTNATAAVAIQCYSGKRQIFNKIVKDVLPGEGFVQAIGKNNTYIIVGDCVITYINFNKHQSHKKH